jgi:outer membrane lipoprotein-sorting protein
MGTDVQPSVVRSRRLTIGIAAAWAVACAVAIGGLPRAAAAQTADAIVARVIEARGGATKIHALQSVRLSGHVALSSALSAPLVVEQRRPAEIREELVVQDKTIVRGYNGTTGWTIDPFANPAGVRALAGDELKNMAAEAEFEPLLNAKASGNVVELVGRDTVGGATAYKLRLTVKHTGYSDYYYVDSASSLPVKWQGTRPNNGNSVVFESYYRDYQLVDGVRFPRVIDTGAQGQAQRQQLTFDHIEVNPAIDSTRFAMPAS